MTMGGLPTRAIAVLSFLLLPPLQYNTAVNSHAHIPTDHAPSLPVTAAEFLGILGEVKSLYLSIHCLLDMVFRNTTETSKHSQQLPARQTLQQGVKLRGWGQESRENIAK